MGDYKIRMQYKCVTIAAHLFHKCTIVALKFVILWYFGILFPNKNWKNFGFLSIFVCFLIFFRKNANQIEFVQKLAKPFIFNWSYYANVILWCIFAYQIWYIETLYQNRKTQWLNQSKILQFWPVGMQSTFLITWIKTRIKKWIRRLFYLFVKLRKNSNLSLLSNNGLSRSFSH